MQWPSPGTSSGASEMAAQQPSANTFTSGYTYRKRQRSPCTLEVPLSDPDIDGERHSHKRYLSEIMATGLSLHMCLDESDMDKHGIEAAGAEAGPSGQLQALMASSPSPPPPLLGAPCVLQGHGDLSMGGTWSNGGGAAPPSPRRSSPGVGGGPSLSPPPEWPSMLLNGRPRPEARSSPILSPRGDRMRSTMPEQSPASPTDGRFPLDLRKTALLRSLLMRTDEALGPGPAGGGTGPGVPGDVALPDEGAMAWQVPLAGPQEPHSQLGGHRAQGLGGLGLAPPGASGQGLAGSGGMPGIGRTSSLAPRAPVAVGVAAGAAAAGAGAESAVRGMSTATNTASRSESLMEDTANSMDTSSTTGSSLLDEEQSRRMSIQGASNLGLDAAIAAVLGGTGVGGLGAPSRHRSSSGGGTSGDTRSTPRARPLPAVPTGAAIAAGLPPRPLFAPSQGLPAGLPLPGMLGGSAIGEVTAEASKPQLVAARHATGRGLFLQLPQEPVERMLSPAVSISAPSATLLPGTHTRLVEGIPLPPVMPSGTADADIAAATTVGAVATMSFPPIPPMSLPTPTVSPLAAMAATGGIAPAQALVLTGPAAQPSGAPSPRVSPTFDEQRLQQLRAKAAAESAKLVGGLEGLGQYRSIAPQLMLSTTPGAALRQPLAQAGAAGMLNLQHRGPGALLGPATGAAASKLPGRKYSSDEGSGSHGGCDLAPFRL